MKKFMVVFVVVVGLLAAGGAGYYFFLRENSIPVVETAGDGEPVETDEAPTTVRVLATGDMIAHDSINQNAKQTNGSYDYLSLMKDMQPYIKKGDVNFCNQSTPAGGEEFGVTGYPVFNAPIAFARGIEALGCNVINIGTNHTNDKGQKLVDATVAAWDDRDILAVAGANRTPEEQEKQRLFTVHGVTFAFVAYTDYTNSPLPNSYGVNSYSAALAQKQIQAVRGKADIVIASMRWGTEYSPQINERQNRVAQELADAGADVVFGHGPHVLQPVKKLKAADGREAVVWFSLGNFLNSQLEVEALMSGVASMEVDIASKKITNIGYLPIYQHYEWTADQKARNDLLARTNFRLVPLDQAAELLQKSQLNTTVEAQMQRISELLTTYAEVSVIASEEF